MTHCWHEQNAFNDYCCWCGEISALIEDSGPLPHPHGKFYAANRIKDPNRDNRPCLSRTEPPTFQEMTKKTIDKYFSELDSGKVNAIAKKSCVKCGQPIGEFQLHIPATWQHSICPTPHIYVCLLCRKEMEMQRGIPVHKGTGTIECPEQYPTKCQSESETAPWNRRDGV